MTDIAGPASHRVDQSALRTNQVFIVGLLVLGFAFEARALVGFVALVLLLGTAIPRAALFQLVYFLLLKPLGIVRPDPRADEPAAHRFAQLLGGLVTLASAAALATGWRLLGWSLSGVVVALASLNLLAGLCVGCTLYFHLGRRRIPGFSPVAERQP